MGTNQNMKGKWRFLSFILSILLILCAFPFTVAAAAPAAKDDTATVNKNSTGNIIDVLANDTDGDGDTLTITSVSQGSDGSVVNNGTSVSYTPDPDFIGNDNFYYYITDGTDSSHFAYVYVTVIASTLTSIGITAPPNKTVYNAGQSFNTTGMVVKAYYTDNTSAVITDYTYSPNGALTASDTAVTVSYGGKTAAQAITVNTLKSITVTTPPAKTTYAAGESFDKTGMTVTAKYYDNTSEAVTDYTCSPSGALTMADTEITVSYGGRTAAQAITVTKALTSIAVTTHPDNTVYTAGERFSTAGMAVTAYYSDNSSAVITDYTYSPNGALAASDTAVTVSYGGRTATQAITVKTITGISVTAPPDKTAYIAGESFDKTGMVVTAKNYDNTSTVITGYTCSPSGALTTSNTVITVSYEGKTAAQAITVTKAVTSIGITAPPDKTAYTAGERFSTAGMVVTAFYTDNSSAVITDYTYSPNGTLAASDTAVTVSYGGRTAAQAITVKTITGISITTPPAKTAYTAGESFDKTGMTVTAKYYNNTSAVITGYTCSPGGALTSADTAVTVSYEGMTATQAITVRSVSGISITTPPAKTTYAAGQSFDKTGMEVTAAYSDHTTAVVTGYTCSPGGALTAANTAITVSYGGKTAVQAITVVYKAIKSIAITAPPAKTSYVAGQYFTKAGMEVTATYYDNTTAVITGYTCSPNGALTAADTAITVSYDGETAVQPVTVTNKTVTKLVITRIPKKIAYITGQTFDPGGMLVTATYNDNTNTVTTGYTCSPAGALNPSDTFVTVSFGGMTVTQAITVTARTVTDIAVTTPPAATVYVAGEAFSPAGMVVTAYFNDNTSAAVTGYTCSPYGALTVSDQQITVFYGGKTAVQKIGVTAKRVTGIAITVPPVKTVYEAGEMFDPAGMTVTAYFSDNTFAPITAYTYTPGGALTAAKKAVTVVYGSNTALLMITVNTPSFTDVAEGALYYDAVLYVVREGLFVGTSAKTFSPDVTMTRAMFVTVLGRMAGIHISQYAGAGFDDVKRGMYYYEYVKWASENKIILGFEDGTFRPDSKITHEQMYVIIKRYAEYIGINTYGADTVLRYSDTEKIAGWAVEAVQFCKRNNMTLVSAADSLDPQGEARRSEVASVLYAFYNHILN